MDLASPRTKRGLDLVLAGALLLATAPLALLAALALALEGGGPLLHGSPRLGRQRRGERRTEGGRRIHDAGGRLFVRRRFRVLGARLRTAGRRPGEDPRLTRVGRVLRRSGLERWPELLSVLAGHMSMVGPRAATLDFRDCLQRHSPSWTLGAARLRPGLVLPGGRRRAGGRALMARLVGDRLHDEEYARRLREAGPCATLWTDLRVLAQALVARRPGAHATDRLSVDYPARFAQLDVDPEALCRSTPCGLGADVHATASGFTSCWYPAARANVPRAGWRAQVLDELADRWSVDARGRLHAAVDVPGQADAGEDRLDAELPGAPDELHRFVDHLTPVFESLGRRAGDERLALRLAMLLLEALLGCDPRGRLQRVALTLRVDGAGLRLELGAARAATADDARAERPRRLVASLPA